MLLPVGILRRYGGILWNLLPVQLLGVTYVSYYNHNYFNFVCESSYRKPAFDRK
jgi:hypothetical protein